MDDYGRRIREMQHKGLKMEEGTTSQGIQAASTKKMEEETASPLQPATGVQPCRNLEFSLMTPYSTENKYVLFEATKCVGNLLQQQKETKT